MIEKANSVHFQMEILAGGLAAVGACLFTNPLEVMYLTLYSVHVVYLELFYANRDLQIINKNSSNGILFC
jgi:hypothetical protein